MHGVAATGGDVVTDAPERIAAVLVDRESYANVLPLLHEIRHALARYHASGVETTIDLRRIPMTEADERELESFLGVGEVRIELRALGASHIHETRFPAVWHVVHENTEGEVAGKFVCVASIPELVVAAPEDATRGLRALEDRLAALAPDAGAD